MDQGTLKLDARYGFFPAGFVNLLGFLMRPVISIDGGEFTSARWGETTHSLAVGAHTIKVAFRYLFFTFVSATTQVTVAANETVSLRYSSAWYLYLPGAPGKLEPAA